MTMKVNMNEKKRGRRESAAAAAAFSARQRNAMRKETSCSARGPRSRRDRISEKWPTLFELRMGGKNERSGRARFHQGVYARAIALFTICAKSCDLNNARPFFSLSVPGGSLIIAAFDIKLVGTRHNRERLDYFASCCVILGESLLFLYGWNSF